MGGARRPPKGGARHHSFRLSQVHKHPTGIWHAPQPDAYRMPPPWMTCDGQDVRVLPKRLTHTQRGQRIFWMTLGLSSLPRDYPSVGLAAESTLSNQGMMQPTATPQLHVPPVRWSPFHRRTSTNETRQCCVIVHEMKLQCILQHYWKVQQNQERFYCFHVKKSSCWD